MADLFEPVRVSDEHYKVNISNDSNTYLLPDIVDRLNKLLHITNDLPSIKLLEFVGTDKYFSAGASLDSLANPTNDILPTYVLEIPKLLLSFKPVTVGNMFGHAIGGGLAFGLWTDLPCLHTKSLYGANFIGLGFTPGMGSTIVLEDYFGKPLAHEMILTGNLFKGSVLKRIPCPINYRIFDTADFHDKINELMQNIINIDKSALCLLKKTLATRRFEILKGVLLEERHMHEICFSDPAVRELIKKNYFKSTE